MLRKLRRYIWLVLLFCLFFTSMFISYDVQAAAKPLDIQIQASFDGKVKEGYGFPVKITLNNPGPEISGQLVIEIAGRQSVGNIAYAKSIDLPQHSEKVIWIALPGIAYNVANNKVIFYKDDLSKGDIVPFVQGPVYISTTIMPSHTKQIGVLASDKDTFNFLNVLNNNSQRFNMMHLTKENLPDDVQMLEVLDYLVINDYATSQLTERQIETIHSWVQQGGHLILAGGAAYPKAWEAFKDISPIRYSGTVSLDHLEHLAESAGKELLLTTPITVSQGELIDGEHLMIEQGIPLFTKREVQQGTVLYVAYDLSLNPLASWNGSSIVWESLLDGDHLSVNKMNNNGLWSINQALDYFPKLAPPRLGVLLLFFISYIILVSPVLYFVLKKWDKREWAWVIVPVFAIVSSVGVFAFGASDRTSTIAQSLNVIEVNDDGLGIKKSYSAFFVPRGGTYNIETDKGQKASPFSTSGLYGNNALNGQFDQILFVDDDRTRIQFRKVPYWSIRKTVTVDEHFHAYGNFDYELSIDAGGISGKLTNTTGVDLTYVNIIMNGQLHQIGEMDAGQTESVQYYFHGIPSMMRHQIGSMNHMYAGFEHMTIHEDTLFTDVLNRIFNSAAGSLPFIMAISKEERASFSIDGRPIKSEQTNVWLQPVQFNYLNNNLIYIPSGTILPQITESDVTFIDDDKLGMSLMMGTGRVDFEYKLPEIHNGTYLKVTVDYVEDSRGLSVWNVETGEWDLYDSLLGQHLGPEYINGHVIEMQYTNDWDHHMRFQYPRITVEGSVSP